MLSYVVDGSTYSLSYRELREHYLRVCAMTDKQFKAALPEILHIACIISYVKEIPNNCLVSDQGLIHLIAHQMHIPEDSTFEFRTLRRRFKVLLELA